MEVQIKASKKDHFTVTATHTDPSSGEEHIFSEELERSEVRELIGTLDNAII